MARKSSLPESVRQHYLALNATASSCIGCQSCESRCPFGVKIAERMEKTTELSPLPSYTPFRYQVSLRDDMVMSSMPYGS